MNFLQFMMANRQQVLELTLEHITLAGVATLLAALVGIPLGILITRIPLLSKPVLGGANIIQTIPSLALFGFLLPAPWFLLPLMREEAALPPDLVRPRAGTVDDCFILKFFDKN